MRRKDTACDTAHCIVPPVGVTAKPSTPRQKVQVALLCGRLASEWTLPMMWTASGICAEADDLRVEADRDVDVILAGQEEERVALRSRIRCAAARRRPCRSAAWISAAGIDGLKTSTLGPKSGVGACFNGALGCGDCADAASEHAKTMPQAR